MLTQAKLKELLYYDPVTGVFTWLASRSGVKAGDTAGSIDKTDGYRQIRINLTSYRAHRLAWLYVHGYFPEHGLDHRDRTRDHDWIDNLREVSQQCNLRNAGIRKDNTSGVKGVNWYKRGGKWRAQITINSKQNHLGYYNCFDEAVCHRLAAEQAEDWANCDSSSPAYQYVQENIKLGSVLDRSCSK